MSILNCAYLLSITNVTVTVRNSFGTAMFTDTRDYRTIEGLPANNISEFGVTTTSSSLLVSWSEHSNVCGNITGYSIHLDSNQVMCYHCLRYQLLFLQITKCNPMNPYNITGLQSFSSYTVSVAACTIAGEESPSTVTGSVMTSAGTPAPVGVVTATGSNESSVTFSWSDVNFNGVNFGYMVSIILVQAPVLVVKWIACSCSTSNCIAQVNMQLIE